MGGGGGSVSGFQMSKRKEGGGRGGKLQNGSGKGKTGRRRTRPWPVISNWMAPWIEHWKTGPNSTT